jgi:hypothetical protein
MGDRRRARPEAHGERVTHIGGQLRQPSAAPAKNPMGALLTDDAD